MNVTSVYKTKGNTLIRSRFQMILFEDVLFKNPNMD